MDKQRLEKILDGAREKAQGIINDAKAGSEIRQGIALLEAMPEVEGSIVYKMELQTAVNSLKSLLLVIEDSRMDTASAEEEIREVMDKVRPADAETAEEPDITEGSEEQLAIQAVKEVAYDACAKALEALGIQK